MGKVVRNKPRSTEQYHLHKLKHTEFYFRVEIFMIDRCSCQNKINKNKKLILEKIRMLLK